MRRPDIDGLRALAVVPVLLFHAEVPGFAGGFVGVDVFFVISGFLITGMIHEALGTDRWSLAGFYERRARRLLPALFAVLFASIVLFAPLLLLNHLQDFANSVIAAALFVSNVFFWRTTDYFAAPAQFHPLLHTWSLGVEAQFYLFYPLLLMAIRRWLPGGLFIWLSAMTIIGFAVAWIGTLYSELAAFYLLPTRAWELTLGGLLAVGALRVPRSRALNDGLALLGIACIAWAVLTYEHTTLFPGPGALLPCVGAALVIYAGSSGSGVVWRFLAWPPIVLIGLASYSIYLWHWPLLVYAHYWTVTPLGVVGVTVALAATLVLSLLTWRFIEQPWRDRRVVRRARTVVLGGTAATAVAVTAGLWLVSLDPRTGQAPIAFQAPESRVRATEAFITTNTDAIADRRRCHANDGRVIPPEAKCGNGVGEGPPTVFVWGDSFGAEAGVALGEVAARNGVRLTYSSYSICPPTTRMFAPARLPCRQHNRAVLDYLLTSPTIQTVVLVKRYLAPHYDETLLDDLGLTVRALTEAGKQVVVVGAIPEPYHHVPLAAARQIALDQPQSDLEKSRAVFEAETAAIRLWLGQLVRDYGVEVIEPAEVLCDARDCALIRDGQPLYFDAFHLTLTMWRELAPRFEPYLTLSESHLSRRLRRPSYVMAEPTPPCSTG